MSSPDRSILLRCLSGEASPEEAALLDTWLSASPANREEFDALWKLWRGAVDRSGYNAPDVSGDWQKVRSRIQALPVLPSRSTRPGLWKVISIIAVSSAAAGLLWMHGKKPAASVVRTVRHSGGAVVKDTLPGGAILTLDRNSSWDEASATLLEGKAFVETPPGKSFTGGAGELSVRSGPGAFLLTGDSILVTKGVVEVKMPSGSVTVSGGQSLYNRSAVRIAKVDSNSIAFATGVFSFTDASLKDLTTALAKAYGVAIRLDSPGIAGCRMTVQFDHMPIKEVMDVIKATLNVQYTIFDQGKTISITGQGCE